MLFKKLHVKNEPSTANPSTIHNILSSVPQVFDNGLSFMRTFVMFLDELKQTYDMLFLL